MGGGGPEGKLCRKCFLMRALNLTVMTTFTRRGIILGGRRRRRGLRLHQRLYLRKIRRRKRRMRRIRRKGIRVQMDMAEVAAELLWPPSSVARAKAVVKAVQLRGF